MHVWLGEGGRLVVRASAPFARLPPEDVLADAARQYGARLRANPKVSFRGAADPCNPLGAMPNVFVTVAPA
eukprot:14450430-Alexandrium_andersonii.AAC.1